ncbi:TPA: acyltransferase [Photobacterium damselae]|uniref:acyltransferase n=1 Tax=Photobacterium damselae TaxID=38293 RepID=UPI00406919FF
MWTYRVRSYIKQRNSLFSRCLYSVVITIRDGQLPRMIWVYRPIYLLYQLIKQVWARLVNVIFYLPMLQARLTQFAPRLQLENGFPLIGGPVEITIGQNTCLNGALSIHAHPDTPSRLTIGDNCYLGWQTSIIVGLSVTIGNNVKIAGRTSIHSHAGHSTDSSHRDKTPELGHLTIEDDVWICTSCNIVKPVLIGRGSVIASGCVVTHDVPPNVLFAGNPGRVIRQLK